MQQILAQLLTLGCAMADSGDAELRKVERDRCAPDDFYSTTNHRTLIRRNEEWVEVQNQRMDALIVVRGKEAFCRRLRDVKAGMKSWVGMHGIRVCRNRRSGTGFPSRSCRTASRRSGRWKRQCGQTAASHRACARARTQDRGCRWAVVVHTGGVAPLAALIRTAMSMRCSGGNALGVHDIENALLGTSLGIRQSDGRQEEHGHRNHMRAINVIFHEGGIRQAVEKRQAHERHHVRVASRARVPFVLARQLA